LIVLFFIPALWQGQSANPTPFSQNLGDGSEFTFSILRLLSVRFSPAQRSVQYN
jgi:hypothetical protein